MPSGRACLGGSAGRAGDGIGPPSAASTGLLLSGGDARASAGVARLAAGVAGVRMTAAAASTPVPGRPARVRSLAAGRGGAWFVVAKVDMTFSVEESGHGRQR
jgi:hypothetical protein